jgi:hypothetical protein
VEPDRPQSNQPATYVIAQEYSSAISVSLRFHSNKEKYGAFQISYYSISSFLLF